MFALVVIVILSFGLGAILGAPFVPTHKRAVTAALDLVDLQPGQHLLDLGEGSGTLVVAAAKRGIRVTGIEINPVLWIIANIRIWPYRSRARVILGNYWQMTWPEADCIYIFLIGHYMARFSQHLQKRTKRPVKVISYTFQVPGLRLEQTRDGLHLYYYEPPQPAA